MADGPCAGRVPQLLLSPFLQQAPIQASCLITVVAKTVKTQLGQVIAVSYSSTWPACTLRTELLACLASVVHAEWASTGLPLLRCLPAVLLQGAYTVQQHSPATPPGMCKGSSAVLHELLLSLLYLNACGQAVSAGQLSPSSR